MESTMNAKIVYLSGISVAAAIVVYFASATVLTSQSGVQTALAYNKFGFDSEAQCIKITNLEHQGGFFDNSTYTNLINMCKHTVK
jgi:hypothetical protein